MKTLIITLIRWVISGGNVSSSSWTGPRNPDTNTLYITSEHILAASKLPRGHAVRGVLAMACVEGYLQWETHKFSKEAELIPGFVPDLLATAQGQRLR